MIRALLLCLVLAACSQPAPETPSDPIVFAAEDIGHSKSVVIGIPGALTSIRVLFPIEDFRTPDRTIAYYRLPGYDDHPSGAPFSIDQAAGELATFVQRGGFENVYFVGHSTGAAIALESAKMLRTSQPGVKVHVAGISTALPAPQPILSGFRSAGGTIAAAFRARSLHPRTVWIEQYRRVSYGPDASHHAEVIAKANELVRQRGQQIQLPEKGLGRKHFGAIIGWRNQTPERLEGVDIAFWHGDVDPVFRSTAVARFAETLPKAELNVLENHGHVVLLTYPEIWDEMANRWAFERAK